MNLLPVLQQPEVPSGFGLSYSGGSVPHRADITGEVIQREEVLHTTDLGIMCRNLGTLT